MQKLLEVRDKVVKRMTGKLIRREAVFVHPNGPDKETQLRELHETICHLAQEQLCEVLCTTDSIMRNCCDSITQKEKDEKQEKGTEHFQEMIVMLQGSWDLCKTPGIA